MNLLKRRTKRTPQVCCARAGLNWQGLASKRNLRQPSAPSRMLAAPARSSQSSTMGATTSQKQQADEPPSAPVEASFMHGLADEGRDAASGA